MRHDGRAKDMLRPVTIERGGSKNAHGSALIAFGDTRVLCTAVIDEQVPAFLRGTEQGWVTAEYAMLPGSASGGRVSRNAYQKGRALEISRLIGRSLRSVIDLDALGERQIIIDCDVLQADGGTRTASITGGYVALQDALNFLIGKGLLKASPLTEQCAAISVGIIKDEVLLDLCYVEDSSADVDLNLVMKSDGTLIEIQGTAEGQTFSRERLDAMLDLGEQGIRQLFECQREAIGGG